MKPIDKAHWKESRGSPMLKPSMVSAGDTEMLRPKLTPVVLAALSFAGIEPLPAHAVEAGQTFSVLIENVSTDRTLRLPDGRTKSAPVAPGAYAIASSGDVVFAAGKPAGALGLESLAEDGNPEPLIAKLQSNSAIRQVGLFVPGQPFSVTANPGDRLVFAAMFGESNDLFLAPSPTGMALFDSAGNPINADLSSQVSLWDAGTEINEAPGAGPNQAPRQAKPDTGPSEGGVVRPVSDSFRYPTAADVLRVTIEAD